MQPLESYKNFVPKVAPTAYVHPRSVVIGDVEIGEESTVWPCAVLRGDDAPIRIGKQTSIQDGAIVHTTTDLSVATVGDRVTVGHNAILHGCIVEDECLIGMGATILDNAVIGTGSIVGACALVTQNTKIPPGSLVLGSPAKVKRPLEPREREMIEKGWKEYLERGAEYRARDGRV
jgi:carbonic anhydrase/acetyltransferase-like protein (isoleucine patch superfamily)